MFSILPKAIRDGVFGPLVRVLPSRHSYQSLDWKIKRFILRWADEPITRHRRWMSSADLPDLAEAFIDLVGSVLRSLPALIDGYLSRDLNEILAYDFATNLCGSVLTKVDRAATAHSLEVRTPLLDNRLIDFAFSLPGSLKVHRSPTKHLLKLACRGVFPDEIIDRPKRGFAIPLAKWISGPLRERFELIFRDSPLWTLGILRRDTFSGWREGHLANRVGHSKPLWALLVLDHWYRSWTRESHATARAGLLVTNA